MRYSYTYDGFNRRIKKERFKATNIGWSLDSCTNYLYAVDNEIGSADAQNNILELRILGEGLGAEIGAAVALELHGKTYVPVHDRQGSVVCLLDLEGKVVEHYRYDVFGNQISGTETSINPWRFSSKRHDDETGLINFGRRYYDPTLGKWLTQDPLGLKAGPNLYAYCLNNPLGHVDPFGLLESDTADRGFIGRIGDAISGFARGVRDLGYKALEKIIHHGPHIGDYNDRIVDKIRSWRGAEPVTQVAAGLHKISEGPITSNGTKAKVYCNGILCDFENSLKNLETMSNSLEEMQPDLYIAYSPSHGLFMDLLRVVLNKCGIETENIAKISSGLDKLTSETQKLSPSAHILIMAHSNGGQTSYLASQRLSTDQIGMLRIRSFGSTKMFESKQGYKDAINYIGWSDWAPILTDPIGVLTKGLFKQNNVLMVGSILNLPFSGHHFASKDYVNAIQHSNAHN